MTHRPRPDLTREEIACEYRNMLERCDGNGKRARACLEAYLRGWHQGQTLEWLEGSITEALGFHKDD